MYPAEVISGLLRSWDDLCIVTKGTGEVGKLTHKNNYCSTLAALTLIILFSKILKFSNRYIYLRPKFKRKIKNFQEYAICRNEKLKINELFDQQLLKLPRYYDIRSLQKEASLGQERETVSHAKRMGTWGFNSQCWNIENLATLSNIWPQLILSKKKHWWGGGGTFKSS